MLLNFLLFYDFPLGEKKSCPVVFIKGVLLVNNIKYISDLNSFCDVAEFLEISTGYLWKIIVNNKDNNYIEFNISKKDGTLRTIYKPINELLVLQLKLKQLLEQSFNPHHKAYGFIKNRDFITNASQHVGKKFVLNLDLENFFETISFGRVRQMFIGYFKLNPKVATTLANICCHHKGFLPQGAPTSPILSNIIMKTLDKQFTKLAKSCTLTYYTRYADDITFSSNNNELPNQLATLNADNTIDLSNTVINLINKNGFKVNCKKVRLQSSKEHQQVTGITVNKKVNINRRYIKNIRATIYSFKSNLANPDISLNLFKEKYKSKKGKHSINSLNQAFRIIKGRILHVSHVRGAYDSVYFKLATDFNQMIEHYKSSVPKIKLSLTEEEVLIKNIFVISPLKPTSEPFYINENNKLDNMIYGQGTGFYLKNIGLITNYHVIDYLVTEVLEKGLKFCQEFYLEYYSENNGVQTTFNARIHCYDKEKDIAILEPKYSDILEHGFTPCINASLGDSIKLAGFPNHEIGTDLRTDTGRIIRTRNTSSNKHFEISANIYAGNSGGPVLNNKNEVIGIAVRGFTEKGVVPSEYISIKDAIDLYNANNEKANVVV